MEKEKRNNVHRVKQDFKRQKEEDGDKGEKRGRKEMCLMMEKGFIK